MAEILISELTTGVLAGTGVFDELMRTNKAHLDAEFAKNRIKGSEYATVYLGSLNTVMSTALTFLLQKQKIALEALLLEQQILLATAEVQKANAVVALTQQQTYNLQDDILTATKQRAKLDEEILLIVAQKCKLTAEYDLLLSQTVKSATEIALLTQKVATEKAQTVALGVDADSVVGKQKGLYQAQTDGFARDAEQKAANVLVDTWKVRRTTDEATVADATNMLSDLTVGRVVNKLLTGVGA